MFQKLRAPENALILFLIILGLVSARGPEFYIQMFAAVLAAAAVDYAATYAKTRRSELPKLGIITGLIIALVLQPAPMFAAAAALIAIGLKHVLVRKGRNIFNPAALGLVIATLAFGVPTTWWGGGHPLALAGIIITFLVRRWETSLSFLAAYAVLWTAFLVFTPFDYTIYFFAFVMVLEPVTTPFRRGGKVLFGITVAALTIALIPVTNMDVLLLSLLVANLFTPWFNRLDFFRRKKQA